ncbi:META domain-containing protein [Anseongella ginsenosidimutans]|uniref:META domain-containing protein n=1 Tax=Anseongella ginsenosidimutans TaxID=496056 RepID=A0A4R3KV10_9SPHI|nr:META domain-containing protein [Anseongella ginsenosidimutans]QEC51776.1 META domain-containing protein [Anseongella ginsenosidimutans]TCS89145.1 META domain-containing protein [Anseongella ginsenosidimutans]
MHFLQLSMLGLLLILQQTCSRNEDYSHKELLNTPWELVSINQETIDSALKEPTLLFEESGSKANGFAGCNQFFGTYSLSADSLSFSGLGSTKMFCEQSQELEGQYLGRLSEVTHFVVSQNGSALTLLSNAVPVLEFKKGEAD